jgi:hypothetical protein
VHHSEQRMRQFARLAAAKGHLAVWDQQRPYGSDIRSESAVRTSNARVGRTLPSTSLRAGFVRQVRVWRGRPRPRRQLRHGLYQGTSSDVPATAEKIWALAPAGFQST